MSAEVYGVSLGPGDPDLVTLKALKVLERVDVIYYPGTKTAGGEVNSLALDILQALEIPGSKLKSMFVAMKMPKEETARVYDATASSVLRDVKSGLRVAFVCLGDAGFYSTFGHLLERIDPSSVSFEMIAGVPAFIAAGARAGVSLTLRSDRMIVLPDLDNAYELDGYLDRYETVVVMKLSMIQDSLYTYLEKREAVFVYAEHLGTSREFVSRDLADLRSRSIPYFSLIILFRKDLSPSDPCQER